MHLPEESVQPSHFTVAVHFLRLLTDYASQHGIAPDALLAEQGLSAAIFDDPNGRVAYDTFDALCEATARKLGEDALGLKLGQHIRPGHLGSHGLALMSCSTVRDLIQQSARYSALTIDAGHNVFELRGREYVRIWHSNLPAGRSLGRIQDELQQSIAVYLCQYLANRHDLKPSWVSFRHARPADVSLHEAIFQCPITFDAPETAIAVDAALIDLPLPHANEQVRRIMDDLCAQLLKQLGNALEPSWLAKARRAVLESFQKGFPDLAEVAKAAELPEQELKVKLMERGLSFRTFIDELRQALAMGYMRDPTLSLVDVAYLLGFSEQSAFQRAFKRWTGQTPGDYRKHRT